MSAPVMAEQQLMVEQQPIIETAPVSMQQAELPQTEAQPEVSQTMESQAVESKPVSEGAGEESSGFEAGIRDMMKPMVKEWLDENLSKLVEDVVRQELASALTKK